MVLVRPTVRALKQLYDGKNLPDEVRDPYRIAKGSDDSNTKFIYLSQAIERAVETVDLVLDAQWQFDNQNFEKHRQSTAAAGVPIFECRERGVGAAWRGAVLSPGNGEWAWLIHVDRHDHFHSEAAGVVSGMRSQGTLGPSPLDLAIAEQHERTVKLEAEEKKLLKTVLSAIKTATIEEREVSFTIRGDFSDSYLQAEVSVQSTSFEEWEIEEAADEIDMIMLRVGLGSDWEFFERFISLFRRYLQPDKTMVDQLGGNPYVIHCAVTRAHLLSLLDIPADQLPTKLLVAEEPKVFHYVDKTAMVESLVTGKAAQAVCGEWWIPIGDEQTHAGLPVCPDCQKEEPFAQAFRRFLRG